MLKTGPIKIESDILGPNHPEFFYADCKLPAGLDIFYFQRSLFMQAITITKVRECAHTLSSKNSFINSCCYFQAFSGK